MLFVDFLRKNNLIESNFTYINGYTEWKLQGIYPESFYIQLNATYNMTFDELEKYNRVLHTLILNRCKEITIEEIQNANRKN